MFGNAEKMRCIYVYGDVKGYGNRQMAQYQMGKHKSFAVSSLAVILHHSWASVRMNLVYQRHIHTTNLVTNVRRAHVYGLWSLCVGVRNSGVDFEYKCARKKHSRRIQDDYCFWNWLIRCFFPLLFWKNAKWQWKMIVWTLAKTSQSKRSNHSVGAICKCKGLRHPMTRN